MIKESIHELFYEELLKQNIRLNIHQLEQFEQYFFELITWNEKHNLTSITNKTEVYFKHFFDSISPSFYFKVAPNSSLIDIGSGAGFPSIPLKIIYPSLKITILDSLKKRIQFIEHICGTLHLNEINLIHGRAEDVARNVLYREQFDIVTARAVAKLNILNEICLPFAKKESYFIVMKGSDVVEELNEAEFSLKELNGKIIKINQFQLPVVDSTRHIILIKKTGHTNKKFPRKAGLPVKHPLINSKQ
jgi:16S rRNA (guanine527-N7)-methyltransferase